MALVTNTEYKTSRGISGAAQDTQITNAIAEAQAYAERWCRGEVGAFESGTKTEFFDGDGRDTVVVRSYPIASVTSITLIATDGSETAYTSATSPTFAETFDFDLADENKGRVWWRTFGSTLSIPIGYGDGVRRWIGPTSRFVPGRRNIKVVYAGGFSTVPADLQSALYFMVDVLLAKAGGDHTLQSESLGAYTWTAAATAEQQAKVHAMLEPYRKAAWL